MSQPKVTIKPYKSPAKPHLKWRVFFPDDNKRKCRYFTTKKTAQSFAETKSVEIKNLGHQAKVLTDDDKSQLIQCLKLLPEGVTLLDAIRDYRQRYDEARVAKGISLREAVDRYLEQKHHELETNQLRELSYKNQRLRINSFADYRGHKRLALCNVTSTQIKTYLTKSGNALVTQSNDLRVIKSFFNWCTANVNPDTVSDHNRHGEKYLKQSPCEGIKIAKPSRGEPAVFSPDQMAVLLREAHSLPKSDVLAVILLQAFGAIRRQEAVRMDWQSINRLSGKITVTGAVAKVAARRVSTIREPLSQWLEDCFEFSTGAIALPGYERREKTLRARLKQLGIDWSVNALRHTCITNLVAAHSGNTELVAYEAGNSSAMIKQNYENVHGADERYWQLTPGNVLQAAEQIQAVK